MNVGLQNYVQYVCTVYNTLNRLLGHKQQNCEWATYYWCV